MSIYREPAPHPLESVAKAALVGAYIGTLLELAAIMVLEALSGYDPWTDYWAIPVIVLAYGTFAIPFTALGLCLFGIPLNKVLRPLLHYDWSFLLAAALGAMAGQVFFWLFTALFGGPLTINGLLSAYMGVAWGLPSGIAYWLYERRTYKVPPPSNPV